jgi:hypothetical protein
MKIILNLIKFYYFFIKLTLINSQINPFIDLISEKYYQDGVYEIINNKTYCFEKLDGEVFQTKFV